MDDENNVIEREQFEFNKYGRRLNQEATAHSHVYYKHSMEPAYGDYDRPIPPNSNVSV